MKDLCMPKTAIIICFFTIFINVLKAEVPVQEAKVAQSWQDFTLHFDLAAGPDLVFVYPTFLRNKPNNHTAFNLFYSSAGRRIQWGLSYETQQLDYGSSFFNWANLPNPATSDLGPALMHGFGLTLKATYTLIPHWYLYWKDSFMRRRLTVPGQTGALMTWGMTLSLGLEHEFADWRFIRVFIQANYGLNSFTTSVLDGQQKSVLGGFSVNSGSLLVGIGVPIF